LANILTAKPEAEISLFNERRTDGSSPTTSTVAGLAVPTTFPSWALDLAFLDGWLDRPATFFAKLPTILMLESFRLLVMRFALRMMLPNPDFVTKPWRRAITPKFNTPVAIQNQIWKVGFIVLWFNTP
jgi:hypothetical protein